MPRAGYCSSCQAYVWLTEAGWCQHGHGPLAITMTYDAAEERPRAVGELPAPPSAAPALPSPAPLPIPVPRAGMPPALAPDACLGHGDMPAALDGFNVGAWGLAPLWTLAYGQWLPFVGLVATIAIGVLAVPWPDDPDVVLPPAWIAVVTLSWIAYLAISLWVGVRANSLVWARRAMLAEDGKDPYPRPVGRYLRVQKRWRLAAFPVLAIIAIISLANVFVPPLKADVFLPGIAGAAAVVLGGWLAVRKPMAVP